MAKDREHCKWIGESGLRYTYVVLRLPCKLHAGQEGNYIFAKQNAEGKWVPVYVGHGDLSIACTPYNPQWECILSHGATHFHCHLSEPGQGRADEQNDLLFRYTNAFTPYGCNVIETRPPAGKGEGSSIIDLQLTTPGPGENDPLDLDDLNPSSGDENSNSGTLPRP